MLSCCFLIRLLTCIFFFFNDTATTEIYTLSLHDALPIFLFIGAGCAQPDERSAGGQSDAARPDPQFGRSEEHTSELQSPCNLVCRLLLEKKKKRPLQVRIHALLSK